MPDYSINQIKRMEQEATMRARRAASMAKPPDKPNEKPHAPNQQKPPEPDKPPVPPPNEHPPKPPKRSSLGFLNALDLKKLIGENSEQALLLLLILVLANDNASDEYLLYALIYIML
ncbi:MAG: hypothetical protein IJO19_03330 [Clostridia bacterium]|nr:hypothetical protein [Clostridia bacterium]